MFAPIFSAVDMDDVIRIIVVVVFFLAPIISQLGKAAKREAPPQRPRKPRAPAPPPPQMQPRERRPEPLQPEGQVRMPPARAAVDAADRLQAEIDEFLRRQTDAPPAPAKKIPKLEVLRPDASLQPQPPAPSTAADPLRGESVEEHVRQHLNTDAFRRRSERLGDELENADEKLESHLQNVFRHPIGQLQGTQDDAYASTVEQGTDAKVWESTVDRAQQRRDAVIKQAADIKNMLSDRDNLKSAIILNEIMRRPNFDL